MRKILLSFLIILHILPITAQAATYQLPDIQPMIDALNPTEIEERLNSMPPSASLDNPLLQLVNIDNQVEQQPQPELTTFDGDKYFSVDIYQPLSDFIAAAANQGYYLKVISGFRTIEYQQNNRANALNEYLAEGYSEADALYLVNLFYALPEASEHLTGLAVDLLSTDWLNTGQGLHQNYQYDASAIWMADNASEFGFVLRYPDSKQEITQIEFEPWHFRYVGLEHAAYMEKYNLVLEEYLAWIAYRDEVNTAMTTTTTEQ